jgi:hypothetical protein
MLDISSARLLRSEFKSVKAGGRMGAYSPQTILEAAAHYRKRCLNEVALDIVRYAAKHVPALEEQIGEEVNHFFATRKHPPIDRAKFLEEARRTLPARLYAQVKHTYDRELPGFSLNFASESESDAV